VITGRDLVMAKVIYREPFSFYVRAGHVMSSNLPLPGVSDTSKGFWRRWELVEFTRSFLPEEENSMIVEAVTSDRQAIACMLIQAAAQFVGNGCRFTQIPPSSEALKVEWQSGAEPVRRWVSDCCEFTFDLVNEGVLWDAFKVWAEGNRHLAMSSATFRGRLCSIMRDLARGRWAQDLGPLRGELAKGGFIRGPNGERQYPLTSPSIAGHAASAATESVGISVERV
jgi:phage/plasmid-associated DNA primase